MLQLNLLGTRDLNPRPSMQGVQGWRSGESTRLQPMWPGFDLASYVRLSLLVLFSAPRGFLRVLRFPLSSKNHILTWFVLNVNLSLQCPQLVLQR